MKALFVIDASGYLYRSYFAITNMTNGKGESTNALFGFLRSVMKLLKDFHPEHCVAVFDGPDNSASRKTVYADYKAHRASMPGDLAYQIDWARHCCDLIGIPQLNVPGVEADDVMGSVAVWAAQQGSDIFLCTSDKDLCQFVDDKIKILNTFKENLILGPQEVEQQFGIPPSLIIDFLAITGDSSDNIPGLPGFGPKTASALLKEFGSLENILANAESLPGKKRDTVLNEGKKAIMSKQLVTIDTSLDIPHDETFYRLKKPETAPLKEFYSQMRFNTLLRELMEAEDAVGSTIASSEEQEAEATTHEIIDDAESFAHLLKELQRQKEICFVVEGSSPQPASAFIVGIGFCFESQTSYYIPFNGELSKELGQQALIERLRPIFQNPDCGFYGHNIKYSYEILLNVGITITSLSFDTMLASYILDSSSRQHSLDALVLEHYRKVLTTAESLIGKGKKEISMSAVEIPKAGAFCCERVYNAHRLKTLFASEIQARGLYYVFNDIEMPLIPVLALMEKHGMYIDVPYLAEMSKEVARLISDCERDIHQLAGETFNINSPKQLSAILFEKMGIKPPKKTATGLSTNVDVLESLKEEYPIAGKILEYRTLEKLRSTYIDTLPQQVNPATQRIHCNFNQTVAATGRLSSQDPNLQNIPVRTKIGRAIRGAFCPQKKGWSYLSADYSQIELRLLAHLSGDPELIQAFRDKEDIHAHTAAKIFNIPLGEVASIHRHHAKAVNFGIIYGQQSYGLSQELGISVKEAGSFIDAYFDRFKRVKTFIEECKKKAQKTGKAVTMTGRERLIPEINSNNGMLRAAAERLAMNTPLQGTAADLIKLAMIRIDKEFKKQGKLGYMILQIHDELLFEVPDFELIDIESIVRQEMEGVWKLQVPLTVDIAIGKNWEKC